ncbi:hypothetical protein, partial [Streptomyces sp. NP160]|uniref:hypothetical protein n=1 Tax=Streptomyces sp. NP160 TaxID=2586637 RepID=UPI001C59BBFC
ALRLPPRWASAHLLVSCSVVVGGAVAGRGPFSAWGPGGAVELAQACACVLALMALVVALHREHGLVAERRLDTALAGARDHAAL